MPILDAIKKLAILLAMPAYAVAAPADLLTLDQALAMAIGHNRGMHNSALEIQKAQDRFNASRMRQFPSMSLYVLGSQQLSSFSFILEKGILGNYSGTGSAPRRGPVSAFRICAPADSICARAASTWADAMSNCALAESNSGRVRL